MIVPIIKLPTLLASFRYTDEFGKKYPLPATAGGYTNNNARGYKLHYSGRFPCSTSCGAPVGNAPPKSSPGARLPFSTTKEILVYINA